MFKGGLLTLATMSRFRSVVNLVTEPGVLQRPDDLRRFLDEFANAHEADLQAATTTLVAAGRRRETGLSLKHLKPDLFEGKTGKRFLKQWADELRSWAEHISEDYVTLFDCAAELEEWDENQFLNAAVEDSSIDKSEVERFD